MTLRKAIIAGTALTAEETTEGLKLLKGLATTNEHLLDIQWFQVCTCAQKPVLLALATSASAELQLITDVIKAPRLYTGDLNVYLLDLGFNTSLLTELEAELIARPKYKDEVALREFISAKVIEFCGANVTVH